MRTFDQAKNKIRKNNSAHTHTYSMSTTQLNMTTGKLD